MNHSHIKLIPPTADRIDGICDEEGGLKISLYLPIQKDPPESNKNPVVLKNLLQEASHALQANGARQSSITELLEPVRELEAHPKELLQYSPGLAIFIDETGTRAMKLTQDLEESVTVSNRFHIKPLLFLAYQNPSILVLSLNRGTVNAFHGDRIGLERIEIEGMPIQLEDVTKFDDPEKSLQQHTGKTTSAEGRPGEEAAYKIHGQGLPADLEDSQLERFFREVAKSVHGFLSGKKDFLVILGVDQNIGLFKKFFHSGERSILEKNEDASGWNIARLRKEVNELLQPFMRQETRNHLDSIQAAGKNSSYKVEEVAMSAATGRIDKVAVAVDAEVLGICNPDTMDVRLVDAAEPGCSYDLLNYIASETLKHGGVVIPLRQDEIPQGSAVAARQRF